MDPNIPTIDGVDGIALRLVLDLHTKEKSKHATRNLWATFE